MVNLGVLLGTSPQHLILRSQEWDESKGTPAIGEIVYTADKTPVGKIADIFGPVSKPFISVQLRRDPRLTLESFKDKRGTSFYTLPAKVIAKRRFNTASVRRAPKRFPRSPSPQK